MKTARPACFGFHFFRGSFVYGGFGMGLLRFLLICGSAAVAAGSLLLGGEVAVTTTSAGHPQPAGARASAQVLADARAALVKYLRDSDPADAPAGAQPGGSNQSAGPGAGSARRSAPATRSPPGFRAAARRTRCR
jgi:hypothetical protein